MLIIRVGDIVRACPDAPYVLTSSGTEWVVYEVSFSVDGRQSLLVGYIPSDIHTFHERLRQRKSTTYLPRHSTLKYKTFRVESEHFERIRRFSSNKQYAKDLLHMDDTWEPQKSPPKPKSPNLWGRFTF